MELIPTRVLTWAGLDVIDSNYCKISSPNFQIKKKAVFRIHSNCQYYVGLKICNQSIQPTFQNIYRIA